jgi:hypothetical protein
MVGRRYGRLTISLKGDALISTGRRDVGVEAVQRVQRLVRVTFSSTRSSASASAEPGSEVHDARNNERHVYGRPRDGERAVHEPEWRVRCPEGSIGREPATHRFTLINSLVQRYRGWRGWASTRLRIASDGPVELSAEVADAPELLWRRCGYGSQAEAQRSWAGRVGRAPSEVGDSRAKGPTVPSSSLLIMSSGIRDPSIPILPSPY